jgi:hypothetical protein
MFINQGGADTVSLTPEGVLVDSQGGICFLRQYTDDVADLKGKYATLSVMLNGRTWSATGLVPQTFAQGETIIAQTIIQDDKYLLRINTVAGAPDLLSADLITQSNNQALAEYAYLAEGERVTLPPYESGEVALRRCQTRYCSAGAVGMTYRVGYMNAGEMYFAVPLPARMRAQPVIVDQTAFSVYSMSVIPQDGFAFDVVGISSGSVNIRAQKNGHGLTDGLLRIETANAFLSADI